MSGTTYKPTAGPPMPPAGEAVDMRDLRALRSDVANFQADMSERLDTVDRRGMLTDQKLEHVINAQRTLLAELTSMRTAAAAAAIASAQTPRMPAPDRRWYLRQAAIIALVGVVAFLSSCAGQRGWLTLTTSQSPQEQHP